MSTIKITEEMMEVLAVAEADFAKAYDRRQAALAGLIEVIERDYSVVPRPPRCKSELVPNYRCELEGDHGDRVHQKVTPDGTHVQWWNE